MENVKAGSESPKRSGRRFSMSPVPNGDPPTSGSSSPTRPVSGRIQFQNSNLRPSGEVAVAGSGLGRSLILSPRNRTLEK